MRSPHFCPFKFYYSRVNKSLQSVIINHIYIYIEIVGSGKFAFPPREIQKLFREKLEVLFFRRFEKWKKRNRSKLSSIARLLRVRRGREFHGLAPVRYPL